MDANPAYLAQLGYTRDELAKKRYEDITPSKWHGQEAQNVAQLKAGGAPMYFEKEHIRKGGTVFPVALTGRVIRDESGAPSTMGVFVQDITERKQAEEALHESESRYRLLVETSIEGIWSMDREHRTTYVNQSMADMLGYEPSEMLGRRLRNFSFRKICSSIKRAWKNGTADRMKFMSAVSAGGMVCNYGHWSRRVCKKIPRGISTVPLPCLQTSPNGKTGGRRPARQ